MTKKKVRSISVWFTLFLIFFSLVFPNLAQALIGDNGGKTDLESDISMMSGIPVHGGGHFNWKVTGAAAKEFRTAIILNYDLPSGQQPPNGQLENDEVDSYLLDLERYLEHEEHPVELMYQGARFRGFQPLDRDPVSATRGLLGTNNQTNANVEIKFSFEAWIPAGDREFELSDTTLSDAIYMPLNETFSPRATYSIKHTEYMIDIGNYENVKINKGDFFLIRTPFGEIYHYSVTFKGSDNPKDKITYQPFSWIECPLVLFIVVVVFGYFIATMPGRFRKYDVMRNVKLHTFAKLLLLILILLYFFAGFGNFFVSGVYLWLLSVIFLFVSLVISKTVYENFAKKIESVKGEEEEAEEPAAEVSEEKTEKEAAERNVQCATCGEIFSLSGSAKTASAPCPACGRIGAVEFGSVEEPPPPPPPPK